MKQITINDLVKIANKAGYHTYLKDTNEPFPLYGGGYTEKSYVLDGSSWESPYTVKESEIEGEYRVYEKILKERAN